jgi:polyhydroxyalkanoate synthesis regulator phasin
MLDELRRVALFGSGVAELTRNRAEQLVKDLTGGGLGAADARGVVKDLIDRSRDNRKEIVSLVRGEIENQISHLGLASRRDIEKLEKRVERLEERYKQLRETVAAAAKAQPKAPTKAPARKASTEKPAG